MQKTWLTVALANFLVVGVLGITMRFLFLAEIPGVLYTHVLHAHSHVAMLGWVYLAFFALLLHSFLGGDNRVTRSYNTLFWLTEAVVAGMFISFILQGYGTFSTFFSAAHVVLSYVFVYRFLRDLNRHPGRRGKAVRMVRVALLFMVFSTLGVWALGPLAHFWKGQVMLSQIALQFFLHFQFNGWFLFAVLGLFYKLLEEHNIRLHDTWEKRFYGLLFVSTFMTFALAVAWSNPHELIFVINSAGVLVQLLAAICFIIILFPVRLRLMVLFRRSNKVLFSLVLFSFLAKILIQSTVAFPVVAVIAYTIRNYVIGFIHIMLLGIFSCFILAFVHHEKIMAWNARVGLGIAFLITGFVGKEMILFVQGTMLWAALGFMPWYYEILFGVSLFLPAGILFILLGWLDDRQSGQNRRESLPAQQEIRSTPP